MTDAPPLTAVARAVDAVKVYGKDDTEVRALDGVTVDFPTGRYTAIMGPSGSGKSTLMHCVAGLDTLTSGQVFIDGVELGSLSDKELTRLRRERIGFVFQSFNLIPTLDALENITLPIDLAGDQGRPGVGRPGRQDRRARRPAQAPAVGALRRAAAARGRGPGAGQPAGDHLRRRTHRQPRLAGRRRDPRASCARRCATSGQTIVMVTHDPVAASYADHVIFLADGQIVDDMAESHGRRRCSTGSRPSAEG